MPTFLLALFSLVASVGASAQQRFPEAPALWANLGPGPHQAGYRKDTSSSGVVHAWYPTDSSGSRLAFNDYLGEGAGKLTEFLSQAGISGQTIDSLLAAPRFAIQAPPVSRGRFPLVLVAQGNAQDVADQLVLCEVPRQGFIVATTPSPMIRTPMEREDQVGELAEAQADDLAMAIEVTANALPVLRDRIGVVGHSFGARAALLRCCGASIARDLELVPTTDLHHVHFTTWGFIAGNFPEIARVTRATPGTTAALAAVVVRTADYLRRVLQD